ncbi:hypothetical protein [uncultured Roseobacter sp.]|uniref:hypothetical protein n=1 Tax=uncultured Roseobacter sp. TaxID=114847 RepID=UPI00261F2B88|nr:hypothetical protein [uncultured Roseobacter sp.]
MIYPAALTLAFLLPGLEWLRGVDLGAVLYSPQEFPPGQRFYLAAKLLGMMAMSVALVQIGLSALGRAGMLRLDRSDHRALGMLITLLMIAHVASFVTGVSIRNGYFTWYLMMPNLTNGSYARGVSMGVIGFWLLLLGVAVHLLRRGLPRLLHRAALVACGLGLVHAVWIGTEKMYIWGLVAGFAALFGAVLLKKSPLLNLRPERH